MQHQIFSLPVSGSSFCVELCIVSPDFPRISCPRISCPRISQRHVEGARVSARDGEGRPGLRQALAFNEYSILVIVHLVQASLKPLRGRCALGAVFPVFFGLILLLFVLISPYHSCLGRYALPWLAPGDTALGFISSRTRGSQNILHARPEATR